VIHSIERTCTKFRISTTWLIFLKFSRPTMPWKAGSPLPQRP
jgi:hypothetical protein